MGRDSATYWDKGTEVPSLSRDKGTMGQAQNLATGQDRSGQPVKIRKGMRDETITISLSNSLRDRTDQKTLSKSGTGCGTGQSLFLSLFSENGKRV